MTRVIMLILTLAGAGWCISQVITHNSVTLNVVVAVVCLGSAAYQIASLVRYP